MSEVSSLFAVRHDCQWLTGLVLFKKNSNNCGVSAFKSLSWTINIKISQADNRQSVEVIKKLAVPFAHIFLHGVGVEGIGNHIFPQGHGFLQAISRRRSRVYKLFNTSFFSGQ